ncbi:MAG: phosphoglycerate dehydrogenase [Lachnospiraceae bacterium]|nr:phosphoglycerate dehydrogenase [Lachnospiraceae bacterium]
MKKKVAFMTRHHSTLICEEARTMLTEAGFEIVSNDTGRILTREEQKALIKDAYAIIAGTEKYDRDMLEGCDNLKVVTRFGVGTDNFDLQAMREMGMQVGVIANYNAVAEFALTLILAVMKNLPRYDAAVRDGKWSRFSMRELTGKTVGLVGFGRIGRRLAELLAGFGVTILAYDPFINEEAAKERHVQVADLDELLAKSDVVSLHLPSTKETQHLINAESIAKMKDGAYLINTARGALVDEEALYGALVSGKLSGASLDVFEKEPVTKENPLFGVENTVLAPHVSALTYETNYNGGLICAESIIRVANGEKPVYPLW